MTSVLVIGGGAAGMAASLFLAEAGCSVHLLEQNEKLGKKLYITGKGRCNYTNACPMEEFREQIVHNQKFMYSSLDGFSNQAAIELFRRLGTEGKIERGQRVFPVSDHSSDVIRALERGMRSAGVRISLRTKAVEVRAEDGKISGVLLEGGQFEKADYVIVATGGKSYPTTGATGDGYTFARAMGHKVTELYPALVPLETLEYYIPEMQGLSLKNVELTIRDKKRVCYKGFGEMLFTHFGISGPLGLTASSFLGDKLAKGWLRAEIDWKPALSEEQLDDRLLREFGSQPNRALRNVLPALLPAKAVAVFMNIADIEPRKPVRDITKKERQRLLDLFKRFPVTITGLRSFKEAIITAGGVHVKELSPKTMESKKVENLYFAGEVLDVDALTGGFNLQLAWSTAWAAARGILAKEGRGK